MGENSLDKYLAVRDVLTWRSSVIHPVAAAIQAWTPKGYHKCCHISTVVTAPQYADRLMMIEATGATGVVPIAISHRLKNFHGQVWWHKMKNQFMMPSNKEKMERWLWQQAWKDYDFFGVFKQMFSYISTDARKLFCSELSGEAIKFCYWGFLETKTKIEEESFEKFASGMALRPCCGASYLGTCCKNFMKYILFISLFLFDREE